MARRFTTGFELGALNEHNGSYAEGSNSYAAAIVTTPVRTGTYAAAFKASVATAGYTYFSQIFTDHPQELYIRLAIRHNGFVGGATNPQNFLVVLEGATQQLVFGIRPSDQVLMVRTNTTGGMGNAGGSTLATGTAILTLDTWYVIEIYVKIANAGQVAVKINGVTDISYSGDTAASANEYLDALRFGVHGPTGKAEYYYFDDIAINDTTGSYQNSWVGTGGVLILKPDAEGDQLDWAPSAGTVHYSLVDEVPANTTDWVQGTNAGLIDLFNLEALPATIVLVDMVEVVMQTALSQTGYNEIQDVVQHGGTIYTGGNAQPVTSVIDNYVLYKGTAWYLAPGGTLAWGTADIDALQAGVKIP